MSDSGRGGGAWPGLLDINADQYAAAKASAEAGFRQRLRTLICGGGGDPRVDALIDRVIADGPALGLTSEKDVATLAIVAWQGDGRYPQPVHKLLAGEVRLAEYRAWAAQQLMGPQGPGPQGTPPADPLAAFGNQPVGDPVQPCPALRVGGRAEPGRATDDDPGSTSEPEPEIMDESVEQSEQQHSHWIEIELVDEDDRPIPGEAFRLVSSEGTLRTGHLDARGWMRIDDITGGTHKVVFPRLGEMWDFVEALPAKV